MSARPSIAVNGRTFAPTSSAAVDTLFAGGGTASGTWKRRGNGVLLSGLDGQPFAYACGNGGGAFMVTAHATEDGRVRFMHSTTRDTERRLGLTGYAQSNETAAAILRDCGVRA